MKTYQYQIIRYVHDHFTGEFVNLGVVVYSREHQFLACKTTRKYQRITHMFPPANGRWVIRMLYHIESQVERTAAHLHELFEPSEHLEQLTASISPPDNGTIRWSETRRAVDIDLQAALEDLYHTQVEQYFLDNRHDDTLADEDVWKKKYKTYFEQYGISNRLKTHEVKIPKDVIRFEKSWKNEIWHCYEPISFVVKEKETVKDKVYRWAGQLKGLEHSNEPLHITLLTSIPERHAHMLSFIQEYLKIKHSNLTVDIVTEDKAEQLAKEVHRQMELHDRG